MDGNDITQMTAPIARGDVCVVICGSGGDGADGPVAECAASVRAHSPTAIGVIEVGVATQALAAALDGCAPADVVVLLEPCRAGDGWLDGLRAAATADTNTATASALCDSGGPLGLAAPGGERRDLPDLQRSVTAASLRLRPRLGAPVGPCVYVRRDALELAGPLDTELPPEAAMLDLAERCLLSGLGHVAADDVVVGRLGAAGADGPRVPELLLERYPHLRPAVGALPAPAGPPAPLGSAAVLLRALHAARRPQPVVSVTIDGRGLGTSVTGTQRHILELIRALAATHALQMRLLTGPETSPDTAAELERLPGISLLDVAAIDEDTPRTSVFHRPQQVFELGDLRLAMRLGERIVVNQLDLIAYRNPSYHASVTAWRSHRRVTRQALGAADLVLVSSEHTRRELLADELAGSERVRIVPPGLDHALPAGAPGAPAGVVAAPARLAAAGIDAATPTLLCLGTDFRHKNRLFALKLLASLRDRHRWEGLLVLAGTHIPHGSSHELESELLARRPDLRAAVIELGPLDEDEKSWLTAHCRAVLYPSAYEGFGLVPLEAAGAGVPCLFAARSSLADILPTEHAALVPWDPDASADNAFELLVDGSARERHIAALGGVARTFLWSDAARSTVEAYRDAIVSPTRAAAALSRDEAERERELHELIAAHDALVVRIVAEREHAQRQLDDLGFARPLIGTHGALPQDLQRGLMALSAKPRLARPVFAALTGGYRAMRRIARLLGLGGTSGG